MVWAQLAMGAMNALTGKSAKASQMKVAKAQLALDQGRANNKMQIQVANNLLSAAQAEVQRSNQARQNRKVMENMEKGLEQNAFNLGKQMDGLTSNRFSARLQGAGALGTLAATAAAAGVAGASVDALANTEVVRQELADQAMEKQAKDASYVASLNNSALVDNAYNNLDDSYVFASFDYSPRDFVLDTTAQYKWGLMNAATDFASGFSGNMNQMGINLQEYGYKGDASLAQAGSNAWGALKSGASKLFGGGNAGATTRL